MIGMSQLIPNAKYVYERYGSKLYAREAEGTTRVLIGEVYGLSDNAEREKLIKTWMPVLEAAKSNPALQEEVDRVMMVYELMRNHDNTGDIPHYPV